MHSNTLAVKYVLPGTARVVRSAFVAVLLGAFLSACGLTLDPAEKLERAEKAMVAKEYRAAIIDAKAVLLDEPDNKAARLLLGRASVAIGDGLTAEKELLRAMELGVSADEVAVDLGRSFNLQRRYGDTVAELDPEVLSGGDRASAHHIRGQAFLGLGQPEDARREFRAVLEIDSSDIDSQLGVVRSYIVDGNLLQARETLDQVIVGNDPSGPVQMLSGALGLQMRDADRAVSDFRSAAEFARSSGFLLEEMQALAGLGDALLLTGEIDEARDVLRRMEKTGPDNTGTLLIAARVAVIDEDWATAQQKLQEKLRRTPNDRAAQMLLGLVHAKGGNLAQAEMYLEAVVSSQPDNDQARRLLAKTRLTLDKKEAALEALQPLTGDTNADGVSLSLAAAASLGLGEADKAIRYLKRAVVSDPDNIELRLQLAFALFRNNQHAQARAILDDTAELSGYSDEFSSGALRVLTEYSGGNTEEALNLARSLRDRWPENPDAYGLAGFFEQESGEFGAARRSFESGLAVAPADPRILRSLAALDLLENDFVSAKRRYLQILENKPDNAMVMIALAHLASRSEAPEETREWLERARETDSESVLARSILAGHYLGQGEYDLAEMVAQEAVRLQPDNARLYNLLGLAKHYKKNYREAVSNLNKAVALDNIEPTYRYNLARTEVASGNNDDALSLLQASSEQAVTHLPSALLEASILARSGQLDKAEQLAMQLQQSYPDEPSVDALAAEILVRAGDPGRAALMYETALEKEVVDRYAIRAHQLHQEAGSASSVEPLLYYLSRRPLDARMRMYLAQAYTVQGELLSANEQYEGVLRQTPDDVVALNNLAWNFMTLGNARAEQLARRAADLQPNNSSVIDTLGWILTREGNLDEGIEYLTRAVELSEGSPDTKYRLASALADSGRTEEAKTILQEALVSAGSFTNEKAARELLARL